MKPLFFDGVVGEKPQFRKSFEQWLILERYLIRGGEWIERFELEKTPQEIELIRFAQEHVASYLKRHGRGRLFDLPLTHIHVLAPGGTLAYTEEEFEGGSYSTSLGSIIIDRDASPMQFVFRLFHELIHWGEYVVIQRTTRDKVAPYRAGLTITTRDGRWSYFNRLSEAVTARFEREFYRDVVSRDERFAAETEGFNIEEFSRVEETQKLNELINLLWEANADSFSDREEVVALFLNAYFHGPLLSLARLIERTQGKGSFRKLGEETGFWDKEEKKVGTEP